MTTILALTAALAGAPAAAQSPPTPASTPARATGAAAAPIDSRFVAPGFTGLQPGDAVVVMPLDVELFSMSAGGVLEPRADWTTAAQQHMGEGLRRFKTSAALGSTTITPADADEFGELIALHTAVARSIEIHHARAANAALPSKNGRLDWSFGDAMRPIAERTGARYALFTWVRDSYASPERKAMMVGMALLGVGVSLGVQTGHASLVDLRDGRVVWFNHLLRTHGDLRDAESARGTVEALMNGFPKAAAQ